MRNDQPEPWVSGRLFLHRVFSLTEQWTNSMDGFATTDSSLPPSPCRISYPSGSPSRTLFMFGIHLPSRACFHGPFAFPQMRLLDFVFFSCGRANLFIISFYWQVVAVFERFLTVRYFFTVMPHWAWLWFFEIHKCTRREWGRREGVYFLSWCFFAFPLRHSIKPKQ